MKRGISLLISVFFLITFTMLFQAHFLDKRYGVHSPIPGCPWCEDKGLDEDVVYVPLNASIMRLISPADPDLIADLLWIRTAYYFGRHALTDREYPYLLHLLDLITDLSPEWNLPYFFGAVILPTEAKQEKDGFYLIEKGLKYHPDDWQLWFFKGFYLWKSRGDVLSAARALHKASLLPGSPVYLARLSATLATRAGQQELAMRFIEQALRNAHDPVHRKILFEKLREVTGDG
ncbi:MAG: hypothetical protein DRH24_20255 [Deltaproteobacteria bacterium]|nr:MAG: hypothetical protein DRH24_20255 [Deltaproteobacteria bacterium]